MNKRNGIEWIKFLTKKYRKIHILIRVQVYNFKCKIKTIWGGENGIGSKWACRFANQSKGFRVCVTWVWVCVRERVH